MAQWTATLTLLGGLVLFGGAPVERLVQISPARAAGPKRSAHPIAFHTTRTAPDDLEVSGLRDGASRFITYAALTTLPTIDRTISDNPDFPGLTLHVTGIYLDQLAKALGAPASLDLIDALCTDLYRSHYPAGYIAKHHPLLVLKIDGLTPAAWAAKTKQDDPGPYFITYEHFVPSFHVLSHADEAQVPTNVVRLNFSTTAKTFGAIAPRGLNAARPAVEQGFAIAKQNCLRCHFMGVYGGTKSSKDWSALGRMANDQPAMFAKYIRDPKSVDVHAQMPGNPEYDDATTAALTAYFKTFANSK